MSNRQRAGARGALKVHAIRLPAAQAAQPPAVNTTGRRWWVGCGIHTHTHAHTPTHAQRVCVSVCVSVCLSVFACVFNVRIVKSNTYVCFLLVSNPFSNFLWTVPKKLRANFSFFGHCQYSSAHRIWGLPKTVNRYCTARDCEMRNTKSEAKKSEGADGKWLSSHTTEITLISRAGAPVTSENNSEIFAHFERSRHNLKDATKV